MLKWLNRVDSGIPGDGNIYENDGIIDASLLNRTVTVNGTDTLGLIFVAPDQGDGYSADILLTPHLIELKTTDAVGSTGFDIETIEGIRCFDEASLVGMFYHADYSTAGIAAKGDRWVPDKGYVDGVAGSNIYNSDGTIDGVTRQVTGENSGRLRETFYSQTSADFDSYGEVDVVAGAVIITAAEGDGAGAETGHKELNISTGDMLITDTIDLKGISYGANYAANFGDRSLVDKAYVDSLQPVFITLTSAEQTTGIASAGILIAGSQYIIKDATGAASPAAPQTIETEGTETIDGSTDDVLITDPYGVVRLYSDGTDLWSF